MMNELLSRENFRNTCLARDNRLCVNCGAIATEVHHILERRLWSDGGYYTSNGASLCNACHILAEKTLLSVESLREKIGIKVPVLPEHLYSDVVYTKWADCILSNGQRTKGELFYDESVQRILKDGNVLDLYTDKVKYSRTYHLRTSPGLTKDDRVMSSYDGFVNENIVITLKLDGECTTMGRDYIHARSLDYEPHPSRDRVKALWGSIAHEIPTGWRVCGENLFAKHSIAYENLESYFMVFSVWNDRNEALSWHDTVEWCSLLGLATVPILASCIKWNQEYVENFSGHIEQSYSDEPEGYVVRVTRAFHYGEFRKVVAKWVRQGHVQTHGHWMRQSIIPNKLKI